MYICMYVYIYIYFHDDLRVNVSKNQNLRSRRQVIDFFIVCLNKPYGKLFLKNTFFEEYIERFSSALDFPKSREV